jgi:murein DD-endopeptidase MepM/ murein hydrolase activator NlpD
MRKHSILLFFITILFVFSLCKSTLALKVTVSPREVFPGDAFVIMVTDTKAFKLSPVSFMGKKFYFSRYGKGCLVAIGAVGINIKSGDYTLKLKIGKKRKSMKLFVKPVNFPTLELTLPEDKVFLNTNDLKRVKKEERKLRSIFRKVNSRLWEGDFILPLENEISSPFGTKRIFNEKRISLHRGMDIRGAEGEEVSASNRGRVILSEELFFGGNTIILDHGQGIYTLYMHLAEINVRLGEIVSKGGIVGLVGSSGRSSGPHLHFGVKVMNASTNPLSLIEIDL